MNLEMQRDSAAGSIINLALEFGQAKGFTSSTLTDESDTTA